MSVKKCPRVIIAVILAQILTQNDHGFKSWLLVPDNQFSEPNFGPEKTLVNWAKFLPRETMIMWSQMLTQNIHSYL